MKFLDKLNVFYKPDIPAFSEGCTHEALCPWCQRFTGINVPLGDSPPNRNHMYTTFCVWCGREFRYEY